MVALQLLPEPRPLLPLIQSMTPKIISGAIIDLAWYRLL